MAGELENRIWFNVDVGAVANFTRLIRRLESAKQKAGWGSATIRSVVTRKTLASLKDPASVDDIIELAAKHESEPIEISVAASMNCWRIARHGAPVRSNIVMMVDCWDHEDNIVRPHRRFEGDGGVALHRPHDSSYRSATQAEEVNVAIADNCETLLRLRLSCSGRFS